MLFTHAHFFLLSLFNIIAFIALVLTDFHDLMTEE